MAWTTVRPWSAQHSDHVRLVAAPAPTCRWRRVMRATLNITSEDRRDYVLAEFRCALIRAKLAALDIEAVACALAHNIVSPEQAVAFFWDSDAIHFLGLELN